MKKRIIIALLLFFALYLFAVEKITNGNMESWASATDLDDWSETQQGGSSVNRDDVEEHGGTYCCRLVKVDNGACEISQSFTMTPSASATLILWYKASDDAKNIMVRVKDTAGNTYLQSDGTWAGTTYFAVGATTEWTKLEIDFTVPAEYSDYIVYFITGFASDYSFWLDDFSIDEPEANENAIFFGINFGGHQ